MTIHLYTCSSTPLKLAQGSAPCSALKALKLDPFPNLLCTTLMCYLQNIWFYFPPNFPPFPPLTLAGVRIAR